MSPIVATLVFLSALLHVSWNTLGKKGTPSAAFFFTASLSSVFVLLPLLLVLGFDFSIYWKVRIYLVVSGFFQAMYYTGLAGAYRTGEMSIAYPLARALPVIFVPFVSFLTGSIEGLNIYSFLGMFIVFTGCMILPQTTLRRLSFREYLKMYTLFAVLAAVGTTGYTLVDSSAMGIIRSTASDSTLSAVFYFTILMIYVSVFLGLYILINKAEQKRLFEILKNEKLQTASAGLMLAAAYIIILICYPMVTHVSYVTAFRQISIPLGAFTGMFFLKEKWSAPKVLGVSIIFTGLLIVYL
jgi:drug/metabolite transporter (DMT)-like permease